jgi:hypothetical protein
MRLVGGRMGISLQVLARPHGPCLSWGRRLDHVSDTIPSTQRCSRGSGEMSEG